MEVFKNKRRTTILLSSVPKREDMCCVVGYVNCSEKRDSSAKSLYHWKIFRCRQLIFSEPKIIASPASGEDGILYIVMTDDYYKSGRLQLHLEKLNMTWGIPEPVSDIIYEACFHYTLIARISPLWNQVDSYLIQDRDFLLSTSPMNAIKFDVIARDEHVFLAVCPLRIRLAQLQKNDLEVKHNSDEKWVCVLPSLKKGCVISVSSFIPDSCPFRTYNEIRRHWKNMYGYRLPEAPDKLFFCSLNFPSFTSTLYTYPSLCLRQHDIMLLHHMDCVTLLQTFVANITSKLPAICGRPFKIESRVMHTVPKLCHWSESLGMANLSTLSESLHMAGESELLSYISQADILSRETCTADSVGGGTNLLPPSHNSSINKGDSLKKEEKLYPVFKRKICPSASSVMKETRGLLSRVPLQSILSEDHVSVTQLSRGAENKKPRLRRQVQSVVDVEALARSRDLARVSTATLVSWLRAKNVSCKVKDRKSVLVEKVMNYLELPL